MSTNPCAFMLGQAKEAADASAPRELQFRVYGVRGDWQEFIPDSLLLGALNNFLGYDGRKTLLVEKLPVSEHAHVATAFVLLMTEFVLMLDAIQ